ncbi:hypothetical protein [Hyalangium minutum]|nr:hypothetical protein [Hyalangium minutum]
MSWSGKSSFAGMCGVVLLGAVMAGCGPVQEKDSSEAVSDVSAESQALRKGDDFKPAALARFGPNVAFGGGKFFVVWNDIREGGVFGTRVRPDGDILDPEGIRINISDDSDDEAVGPPAITYNGTHFFVVWERADGVSGVRVKPDGTVVGPVFNVITSGETFGPVDIACSKDICVVTFRVTGDDEDDIFFRRVTKNGIVLRADDESVTSGNFARDAAVAWSSNKEVFLVVWSDSRGGEGEEDIFGNRLTEDGEILDGNGFPISEADGAQLTPDVAWSGKRFHVVWSDTRNGDADIFGARVRGNGKVDDEDGIPISKAKGDQLTPRVAHDDSNSLVVWTDTRNGKNRIRGARLEEDGEVKDNGGFAISDGDKPQEFLPAVAAGADRFFTAFAGAQEVDFLEPHFILGTRVTHQGQVKDSPALKLTLEPK